MWEWILKVWECIKMSFQAESIDMGPESGDSSLSWNLAQSQTALPRPSPEGPMAFLSKETLH